MVQQSQYRRLPETRRDLGYEWIEMDTQKAVDMLKPFLERVQAKAFFQDVYASNNQVYRNIIIQLPGTSAFPLAEDIHIQFNRDEGRQFNLYLEH